MFEKNFVSICMRDEQRIGSKRLEFLTSISLVQNFQGLDVNPNYAVDDEGLPTFTATGGYADIECYDTDCDSYFEVTMMCRRSKQVNNEIISISRHLREVKAKRREEFFSVLFAHVIFRRGGRLAKS